MGTALHADTIDARFDPKNRGFSYNNDKRNDRQSVKRWEITKSSDAPNINKNQIIIALHNRETNKIQIHVKNSTDIIRLQQNNDTMHQTTINHYLKNETVNSNKLTILTGGSFLNGDFLGRSRTINISNDGYHKLNESASHKQQASKAEMAMLQYVFDSNQTSGTFNANESIGGVELSLKNLNVHNLYGFEYNKIDNTLIGLYKKTTNDHDLNQYQSNGDSDSILKHDNHNSVMVWQHFCVFLQMFHTSGSRESVSFSLDPDQKINKNQQNINVRLKKVYYPETLRWSKAGEVMFDADWFLKTLLYDMHPEITRHIPNYQSYIDKVTRNWNNRNCNWHRLWIVLDETEEMQTNNLLFINNIKFKIRVRKMTVGLDGDLYDVADDCYNDEHLTEFINHVNRYMYIVQRHSLFLQRLEAVYCALLLAKCAYNNNIPFDMKMIQEICHRQKQELIDNNIKFSLPSIHKRVEKCRERYDCNYLITETKSYSFRGGIDLNINRNVKKNNKNIKQIQKTFNKTHKAGASTGKHEYRFTKVCDIKHNGEMYTAVLFPAILFDKDSHHQKFIKYVFAIIFGWFCIQILLCLCN